MDKTGITLFFQNAVEKSRVMHRLNKIIPARRIGGGGKLISALDVPGIVR